MINVEDKAQAYFKGTIHVADTQWGDGGKGKIVDLGASEIVVKTNGGDNAGHTVCNEHGTFPLHLVPSGIFKPDVICMVGSGVVLNPLQFFDEYQNLKASNINLAECQLAEDAHMILPWHKMRESLKEQARGEGKIGTTGKGIGDTYADRTNRVGLRLGDLKKPDFQKLYWDEFSYQQRLIQALGGDSAQCLEEAEKFLERMKPAMEMLAPMITDTKSNLGWFKESGANILGEAGQGALLDVDLGTWPYVTSSHPGIMGFMISTGFSPREINKVVGVSKAYMTRVGNGPMPTELGDDNGQQMHDVGNEKGTTTGRDRRCGWFDVLATEYGARTSGVTDIALTKLDVLDGFDKIWVCTGYEIGGDIYRRIYNANNEFMQNVKPCYEVLPGWKQSIQEIRCFEDLPQNARNYVNFLESRLKLPISIISVGPHRDATIFR